MMLSLNNVLILAALAVVGFFGAKWAFGKDTQAEDRRRGAVRLAASPDSAAGQEKRARLTRRAASSFWFAIAAVGLVWASEYMWELVIVGIPMGIPMKILGYALGALALVRGVGSLRATRDIEGESVGKSYAGAASLLGLAPIGPLLLMLVLLLLFLLGWLGPIKT